MILDDIVEKRRRQLEREQDETPFGIVEKQAGQSPPCRGFYQALAGEGLSVIAEVKKASPSKGLICADFNPVQIARDYEAAGAQAVSVLTEEYYFQGNSRYLTQVRKVTNIPILRKDFIISAYQVYEAKAIGADAILLIAALLDTQHLREYLSLAGSLGLDCLLEVHNPAELNRALEAGGRIIGINNRDLTTFNVDLAVTEQLAPQIPKGCLVVAESGIRTAGDMRRLRDAGADAVLIGETLMRQPNGIPAALKSLREGIQ